MKKILFYLIYIITIIPNFVNCQTPNINLKIKGIPSSVKSVILSVYNPFNIKEFDRNIFEIKNGECILSYNQPVAGLASINLMTNRNPVYLTPGDTIECEFKLEGNTIIPIFTGKNSAQYNFFKFLKADSSLNYPFQNNKKYENNIKLFFADFDSCYNKQIHFLNDYCKSNKTSDSFKKDMEDEFHFTYLYLLLFEKRKILSLSEFQTLKYQEYSEFIFHRDDLIKSRYYTIVLLDKYLFKYLDGGLQVNQNIANHFKDINKSGLSGLTKEYLLTSVLKYYTKRGFTSDYTSIDSIITVFNKEFQNKAFRAQVNTFWADYKQTFKPLADSVLNEKLVNFNGKSISFEDLMNQYEGKTIYIDFWASWCGPCKMDILSKEAVEMRNLGKSKNVVFLSISLDKTEDQIKWINTTKTLPLEPKYQYRLVNDFNSPLTKYFNINAIPHYVLILKDGRSRIEEAPRITDTKKLKQYFD